MKKKKEEDPGERAEKTIQMLKDLMAGVNVKAVTPWEKKTKASLLKDIAYAKKNGFQIDIPVI